MPDIQSINLNDAFTTISDHWSPRVAGRVNSCLVKLVKIQGEFVWHSHDTEDEMFLVIHATMTMHLRDKTITVNEGEFVIIPAGVEHKPEAHEETHILLFEPDTTLNTGNVRNDRTVEQPRHL